MSVLDPTEQRALTLYLKLKQFLILFNNSNISPLIFCLMNNSNMSPYANAKHLAKF